MAADPVADREALAAHCTTIITHCDTAITLLTGAAGRWDAATPAQRDNAIKIIAQDPKFFAQALLDAQP